MFPSSDDRETKLQQLRHEIDLGLRDIERGDYNEIENEQQLQEFFDDIERRGVERRSSPRRRT